MGMNARVRRTGVVQCGFLITECRIRNAFVRKKTGHQAVTGFLMIYSLLYDF
jgi:hypothetical protein